MMNQEMFDRAWRGLKGQGWEKAHNGLGCVYSFTKPDGRELRCAWGHVDTALTTESFGVRTLRKLKKGLAATLDDEGVYFATELQGAHDDASSSADMEARFREVAAVFNLSIPED